MYDDCYVKMNAKSENKNLIYIKIYSREMKINDSELHRNTSATGMAVVMVNPFNGIFIAFAISQKGNVKINKVGCLK